VEEGSGSGKREGAGKKVAGTGCDRGFNQISGVEHAREISLSSVLNLTMERQGKGTLG
jgi:hypothetical protein